MNREILFRGKLSYCNKWIEGNLIIAENGRPYIIPKDVFIVDGHHLRIDSDSPYWVIPETVCQFTGLLDKNDNKIYEGDIVKATTEKGLHYWSIEYVRWYSFVGFVAYGKNRRFNIKFTDGVICRQNIEVIGNIHDNPELLK